mgnify:CR=1 FL=1
MNEQITVNLNNFTKEEREQFYKLLGKGRGKQGKEGRVWKAGLNQEYYFVDDFGIADTDIWGDCGVDRNRFGIGNVFETREKAEFAREKAKVKAELERYALEHNDPKKEAWDGNSYHYEIVCAYLSKEGVSVSTNTGPYRGESITYFTSKEIAENAIEAVGEERILKYLFGVDC